MVRCLVSALLSLRLSLDTMSITPSCPPAGTDLSPIMPVLAKVFDQALAGGAAILATLLPGPACPETLPVNRVTPVPSLLLRRALFA